MITLYQRSCFKQQHLKKTLKQSKFFNEQAQKIAYGIHAIVIYIYIYIHF